jgi:hypothetical protein
MPISSEGDPLIMGKMRESRRSYAVSIRRRRWPAFAEPHIQHR